MALLLPLVALVINFSYADVSDHTSSKDDYARFLNGIEDDALILAWYLDVWPLLYLQNVEKIRPDVKLMDRFQISRPNESRLIEQEIDHRAVYVFGLPGALPFPHRAVEVWDGDHDVIHRIVRLGSSDP